MNLKLGTDRDLIHILGELRYGLKVAEERGPLIVHFEALLKFFIGVMGMETDSSFAVLTGMAEKKLKALEEQSEDDAQDRIDKLRDELSRGLNMMEAGNIAASNHLEEMITKVRDERPSESEWDDLVMKVDQLQDTINEMRDPFGYHRARFKSS